MGETKNNYRTWGLAALTALLLVVAFYTFWPEGSKVVPSLAPAGFADGGNGGPSPNQEFLRLLAELTAINLPEEIFESPAFQSLQDFSQPLPEEIPGRVNPFAPLGVGGRPASTTSPSASSASTTASTTSSR